MKKINRSHIYSFILGAIIFGSVGVGATMVANSISYTPKDTSWNVDNVSDAIDDLYNNKCPNKQSGTEVIQTSQANNWHYKIITFSQPFSKIPKIYMKPLDGSGIGSYIKSVDENQFEIGLYPTQWSKSSYTVEWLAVEE